MKTCSSFVSLVVLAVVQIIELSDRKRDSVAVALTFKSSSQCSHIVSRSCAHVCVVLSDGCQIYLVKIICSSCSDSLYAAQSEVG